MRRRRESSYVAALLWLAAAGVCGRAIAQSPAPAVTAAQAETTAVAASPPAAAAPIVLHANAAIPLRFVETVSSSTHIRGSSFQLQVSEDVTAGDQIVIPAGTMVQGEVIHAQKAGMLGKPGELIVAARFVMLGERQLKLRAQLMRTGVDKTMAAFMIVPFIKGKDLVFPADTEVIARTVVDESFTK